MERDPRKELNQFYSAAELSLLIAQEQEKKQMARLVVTAVPSLLDVPFAVLWFLEGDADWLVIGQRDKRPLDTAMAEVLASLLASGLAKRAFSSPGLLLLADFPSADGEVPEPLAKLGIRSLLVAPVRTITNSFGVMILGNEVTQDYTPNQRLLISTVVSHVAISLENARLYEDVRRSEKALKESEKNFRNSLDNSPLGVRIVTAEGELLYANQAILDIWGYSSIEELKSTTAKKLYAPESYAEHQERKERRRLGKPVPAHYEIGIMRKDGEVRHLAVFRKEVIWDGKAQYQVLYQDITERKRAEDELRKFKTIADKAGYGVAMVDLEGNLSYVNDFLAQMHGYTPDELIGKHLSIFHNEEQMENVNRLAKQLRQKGSYVAEEVWHIRKDDSEFPTLMNATLVRDQEGTPLFKAATVIDITERKKVEEALRESNEFNSALLENAPNPVLVFNADSSLRYVNPALEKLTGFSKAELLGRKPPCPWWPQEKQEEYSATFQKTLLEGTFKRERLFQKKTGKPFWVEITSTNIQSAGQLKYHLTNLVDITKRKLAEERERQWHRELDNSSRLAAIGQLAAGVAHEINNPLTGILGFSERLLRKSTSEEVRRDLERIHSEAQRAAKVVQNLLTFARHREPKKQECDINEILQKALELRAYELKTGNIEVVTHLAPGLPKTMVDFHQIQEVFLNLTLNAEQAMIEANQRGKLIIKTGEKEGYIRVSFTDDGSGISAEHLDKLFTPFFTTRREKGGTGLGLSICHGIVGKHGGMIYAKSKPGEGTTFVVELPLTTEKKAGFLLP